jgi:hypothetical protein
MTEPTTFDKIEVDLKDKQVFCPFRAGPRGFCLAMGNATRKPCIPPHQLPPVCPLRKNAVIVIAKGMMK